MANSTDRVREWRHKRAEMRKAAGVWGRKPTPNSSRTDGLRTCARCHEDKPEADYYKSRDSKKEWFSSYCKPCCILNNEDRRKKNPEVRRKYDLKGRCKSFGTTPEWFKAQMAEQDGKCALCKQPETHPMKRGMGPRNLAIDHDHETGKPRGLLCFRCNTALHQLEKHGHDWAERAVAYLRKET